jgi:Fusaric acid resistance protein-like
MKPLNAHERSLASLARSLRATIVVTSLFALAFLVIQQPEAAGFAVFGTFAHQVLVNYDTARTARFAQSAMLTLLGSIMLSLGTLASTSVWLAVGGTVVVGFLSELPLLSGGHVGAIRRALLLSFMVAVAAPAPAFSVLPYLAGWLTAGIIAQPALLLIWVPFQNSSAAAEGASSCERAADVVARANPLNWMGKAIRSGLALGLAVLLTRLFELDHAFWVVLGVLPVLSASEGSVARTFWREQVGTLVGFSISVALVAIVGPHQVWYWLLLPFAVFGSVYAASAVGLVAGQAAFTVFAVVLFCILSPQQQAGVFRLEDIAIGGAVSLIVGLLRRDDGSAQCLRSAVTA